MSPSFIILSLITLLIVFIRATILPSPALASDERVLKLAHFLIKHDSPLAFYASDFVETSDKYGLDYRLLAAISGVESTFGKFYIPGTYNTYGWGGGTIVFKSWPEGIERISFALKTNYVNRGAKNIDQIGRIYCPPNSAKWTLGVNKFMADIEAINPGDFRPKPLNVLIATRLTI